MDLLLGWFILAVLPALFIRPSGRTGSDDPVVVVLAHGNAAETRSCRFLLLDVELFGIRTAVAEGGANVIAETIPAFPIRRITNPTQLMVKSIN